MLVKVSDGEGGFVLFDKVSRVHTKNANRSINAGGDLDFLYNDFEGERLSLIPSSLFTGKTVQIGTIKFSREGQNFMVLFTNVAYVCDDVGTTVETVKVK